MGIALLALKQQLNIKLSTYQIPCVFHQITGYYCPGCGGTRAVKSLLHGQLLRSFCYHPVVIYGTVLYLIYMITQTLKRVTRGKFKWVLNYHDYWLWTGLVIMLVNWLLKNAFLLFLNVDLLQLIGNW